MARENASPCRVYWSQTANSSTRAPPPTRSAPESTTISSGRSIGALNGTQNFDPPRRPGDGHALMPGELRAALKVRWRPPGNSMSALASRSVPKFGIDLERGDEARRLGAEDVARGQDRIAADVVEPAAARRLVADIAAVEQAIGEQGLDRADLADCRRTRTISRARRHCGWKRTMKASVDQLAGSVARGDQPAASSASSAIGFSHSTCLPAASARSVQGTCSSLGSGL